MNDILAPEQEKRGPGRPAKTPEQIAATAATSAVKKGNPTWKPASVIETIKRPGYTPRMINKDPDNLARKKAEGWVIESGLTHSSPSMNTTPYGRPDDGKPLTSVTERHDSILAWIPDEMAQQRREYYQDRTARMEQALMRETKSDMAKATGGKGVIHGDIKIEKRGTRTVIED